MNQGQRRAEVVENVLISEMPQKVNAPVGVVAYVHPSKMKPLTHGGVTAETSQLAQGSEAGKSEAAKIRAMQAELKHLHDFSLLWAQSVVEWGKMMSDAMHSLQSWALSLAKVFGLSAELRSEAFDAFVEVVQKGLLPLVSDLEMTIHERLLKELAHLLKTLAQPLKLLTSIKEQELDHCHFLSTEDQPQPSLATSTNYLALRSRLAAELPTYIALMQRGLAGLVRRFANMQVRFWRDVKNHWTTFWDMVRVGDELSLGSAETISTWCERWVDVDGVVAKLGLTNPEQHIPQEQLQKMSVEAHLKSQELVFLQDIPTPVIPHSPGPHPLAPSARSRSRDKRGKHKSRSSTSINISSRDKSAASPVPQSLTVSQYSSLVSHPTKYICQVVHECRPPTSVSYYCSFPFLTLQIGELYHILQEAGHPNVHPGLPLHVDNGEDCLLLCRDGGGLVGWALASFLVPLSLGS